MLTDLHAWIDQHKHKALQFVTIDNYCVIYKVKQSETKSPKQNS